MCPESAGRHYRTEQACFKAKSRRGTTDQPSPRRPHEIHAQQSFIIADFVSAPHGLVADAHPVLVSAHFCSPQPRGPAQDDGVGVRNLLDLDVGALQRAGARGESRCGQPEGAARAAGAQRGREAGRALTCSAAPGGCCAAGQCSTSCTSSRGRSEFLPNTTRPPAAAGGSATNVSQERGGGRAAMALPLRPGRGGAR